MASLSKRFRDTFRDIFEKSILALWLSFWVVVLHFARVGCVAAHLPAWILFLITCAFGFIILADAFTIVELTVALLIRLTVDMFRELKVFIKGP